MRLIDADKLKSIIDPKEKWILELIDEEPTAYSVGKIVAELEENSIVEMKFNGRPPIQNIDIAKAIDIVRKGGVE